MLGLGLGLQFSSRVLNRSFIAKFGQPAMGLSFRDLLGTDPNVTRIRRDNDDAELDFKALEITDGTLTTWVGAGNNGLIRTMYGQGNAANGEQSVASSQIALVVNGVLQTENGLPKGLAQASKFINIPLALNSGNTFKLFSVIRDELAFSVMLGSENASDYLLLSQNGSTNTTINSNSTVNSIKINQSAFTLTNRGALYTAISNQSLVAANVTFNFAGSSYVNTYQGGGAIKMLSFQEIIIYPDSANVNIAQAEANISAYWMTPRLLLEEGGGFLLQENGSKIIL